MTRVSLPPAQLEMEEFVVSTWPLLKPFFHPLHVPGEEGQPPAETDSAPQQQQQQQETEEEEELAEGEELTAEELAAAEVDAGDLVTPGTGTVEELDRHEGIRGGTGQTQDEQGRNWTGTR